MSAKERDNKLSKQQPGDQTGPKAAKQQRSVGLNGILETVRQKMAYTIRGI